MKKKGLLALLAILVLFAALSVSAYADAFDELVAANNDSDTDPFTGLTQALADETVHFYEMSDKGSVTILQNTVIRSDFNVSAMNTELIIPAGVTLTLNGSMSATQLTVQEGGTLRVEGSSGRLYQKGRPVRDDKGTSAYQIEGLLEVVDGGKLNLRPESWDGINKDKINAHGEDALISISVPIN
nr:hypothetical protein [Oscillospiraceae bacterium]